MKNEKTKIISFANHKGGVGKTTSTVSVGTILARQGYKVLLVDMDAQANLTSSLVSMNESPYPTIYEALTDKLDAEEKKALRLSVRENLWLYPSNLQLAKVDFELAAAMERERKLQRLLEPIQEDYDFILIDCPPSLGIMTLNSFTASNEIIIPMIAEVLPFQGLTKINDFIATISQYLNPQAHVSGILLTRWESTNLSKQIEQGLRDRLGDKVFTTKIRKNVSVAEAPLEVKNIVEYAPKSNGAMDYKAFTTELLQKLGI